MQEHEFLLAVIDMAGTYDQLDLTNLAWAESVMRRLQTIEWAYHEKLRESGSGVGKMEPEEMSAFAGTSKSGSIMMVCPELLDHVKGVVERDAVIMKNLRKAREERAEKGKKKDKG